MRENNKEISPPENMVTYDPKKPLYSRERLCIYLSELYDLMEKEQQEVKEKKDASVETEEEK